MAFPSQATFSQLSTHTHKFPALRANWLQVAQRDNESKSKVRDKKRKGEKRTQECISRKGFRWISSEEQIFHTVSQKNSFSKELKPTGKTKRAFSVRFLSGLLNPSQHELKNKKEEMQTGDGFPKRSGASQRACHLDASGRLGR